MFQTKKLKLKFKNKREYYKDAEKRVASPRIRNKRPDEKYEDNGKLRELML